MGARNRIFVLLMLLVVALAVGVAGCQQQETGDQTKEPEKKEPIKIGAVVSLTGTYAGLGEPEKNALELEAARINDAGGVNGRMIEVVIEDDGTDDSKAVAAATKLLEQDKVVALIGATGTSQTMAIRDAVNTAGVPQVSMAGGTVITAKFDPLVFQTPWSNTLVIPYTLEYLKGKGLTKIGMISDSGGFGKDGASVVETMAANYGIEIVAKDSFNPGDTDMTTQLTKIKNSKAQAVLMVSAGKEASIVAKNMQQLKMTIPLVGTHGNARKEFIAGAADAAEGFRFAAGKILLPDSYGMETESYKVAKDFIDRYTAKYGDAPNTFAGHAYDSLYLIVEAAKRLPADFTAAQLRDEIEKTSGFVGIGGVFTYSATDHNGLSAGDLNMYEIKGGEWKLAE